MSSSFLFCISITLLVLTLTVESVYNPYLYDDGNGGEEHCCLVRVRENFCLATPITRSLIQVNQQCGQFNRPKRRRLVGKKENNEYLDKISRRLNVQTVQEIDDKILIELQKPLEKNILENDLICLTSTNNNINLEKCHVELADEFDDDYVSNREHRRRKYGDRHRHFDHKKLSIITTNEEENSAVDDYVKNEENEAENEIHRIELAHPVRIREGHGLSIRQRYQIDPSHIRLNNRQEHQCWSWYRRLTRKIRQNPSKHFQSCINLNDHNEKCINQLIYNTFNNTKQEQQTKISFPFGSKLYFKNNMDYKKLIGLYHHSDICFYPNNQIYIEHKFTDIASLSDTHKNEDILDFIAKHKKLTAEFEDDCHGKTNLVETNEPAKTKKII